VILGRSADAEVAAQLGRGHQQRVGYVVASVAHVGQDHLVQGLGGVFHDGQEVGQGLGGVELVGQAVPDRHSGVLGQLLDDVLAEPAILDAVIHAAQHPGSVLHGFLDADVGAGGAQVGGMGALVVSCHFEGTARPGGLLLEDQGNVLAHQAGLLIAGVFGGLEVR